MQFDNVEVTNDSNANVQKTMSNVRDFVIVVENVAISDSDFILHETFAVNFSNNFLSRYLLFVDMKIWLFSYYSWSQMVP